MPSAYQGFCTFRKYPRLVNWAGLAAIPSVWLVIYTALAAVSPWGTIVGVGVVSVGASVGCGIFSGFLYGQAIGSPYGNITLPLILPALIPAVVYTSPFGIVVESDFWTWPQLPIPVVSGVVAVGAALVLIERGYRRVDDPVAWEQSVFPYGFRVIDADQHSETPERTNTLINCRPRTTLQVPLSLDMRGWLLAMLLVAPLLAVAQYGRVIYDDQAFSAIMAAGVGIALHLGLRPDTETER